MALYLHLQPGGDLLTLELTPEHLFLHCDGAVTPLTAQELVDLAQSLKGDAHVRPAL